MTSPRKTFWRLVVLLTLSTAAGVRFWQWHQAPSGLNRALHAGIGERLAYETTTALNGTGAVFVVKSNPGQFPELDLQWAAFRRRLAEAPGITVLAIDLVDAGRKTQYVPGTGMSARRYLRLAAKHPQLSLIVSFLGAPDPKELPTTRGAGPRLVAWCRSPRDIQELFHRGYLAAALIPRVHFPAPGPDEPTSSRDWFERQCEAVTPDMVLAGGSAPGTAVPEPVLAAQPTP